MFESFSQERYEKELEALFVRFPSVQNVSFSEAYKPGLERMLAFNELLGFPDKNCRIIHVAGTNGKGSVSNMLASSLAAHGYKTGIYTSPHIEDFRERMRIARPGQVAEMVSKEYVYSFILRYKEDFNRLSLSFFEITTGMALKWFADEGADFVVLEVGLGGRLDSTNIVCPELSIITSIGLDHCDLLGHTLAEVAKEKAGIIKDGVPVVIGEKHPETQAVFEACANEHKSVLRYAEDADPTLWHEAERIRKAMDLQGVCQIKNLRTVMTALDILGLSDEKSVDALIHTASRMDFHGRWEKLMDEPLVICDIGHNSHALGPNFKQLESLQASGEYSKLIIVYAVMGDKDFDSIMPLMPLDAKYLFTTPASRRSMPAFEIKARYESYLTSVGKTNDSIEAYESVKAALDRAMSIADQNSIVYIGGSTFAVSEAIPVMDMYVLKK